MMCHALAALSVTRTVFGTWAIYVIIRTGHIIKIYTSYKKDTSYVIIMWTGDIIPNF